MAKMLLLNPSKRRARRTGARKGRTAAQKRATLKMLAANRRSRGGSSKPARRGRAARRRNPVSIVRSTARRRRRNPISLGGLMSGGKGYMGMFKDALVAGGGAVAVDLAFGQVNGYLPASLQRTPGRVGVGDLVKAIFTVAVGKLLAKPTRGLSQKAAAGALTVQAHQLIAGFVPSSMVLGYASPARIANMQSRVGPNVVRNSQVGRFVMGKTPLLNAFTAPGTMSPLLNGSRNSVMVRESAAMIR